MPDPFTDYQRIVHRTSDLIAVYRTRFDRDSAIGIVLEYLEREYAVIIDDETCREVSNENA